MVETGDEDEHINEFVIQLAQLWVVAQCKCSTRMFHSTSHLDCFCVNQWLIDEFKNCVQTFAKKLLESQKDKGLKPELPRFRINSTDSLHIEIDSLCSTARNSYRKM